MSTTLTFKDVIDLPEWRPLSPAVNQSTGGGAWMSSDLRNNEDRLPFTYYIGDNGFLSAYNFKNDGHTRLTSSIPASVGTGSAGIVAPQRGPRGTLAAGSTTTSIVLSTALPASVAVNQLANRGDGVGFKLRIIGNSGGGSGKTEETYVTANTSGTTPTLTVSPALSFSPASGDAYEFLSGRVYMMGSLTSAGNWKAYDVLTNSVLANLSVTNLATANTADTLLVCLDELYVPAVNAPGQGFLLGAGANSALTATLTTGTTLTGQAAAGDAAVLTNEYRNFQIRITKDVAIPTSVGQRRKITSHTAGAAPVYTVPTWTVTPSITAEYVIEYPNEILQWCKATTNTTTYVSDAVAGGQSADTWSTATYAARGTAPSQGSSAFLGIGATTDAGKNFRYSFIFSFRGGNATLDVFDIAGAATGTWSNNTTYGGSGATSLNSATGSTTDPTTGYAYIQNVASHAGGNNFQHYFYRFDCKNRVLETWSLLRYATSASAPAGGPKLATSLFVDGSTKLCGVIAWVDGTSGSTTVLGSEWFQCFAQR